MQGFETIYMNDNGVTMIEQRDLPQKEIYKTFTSYTEVATAIKDMTIRGAPAIGVAAAMGIALAAKEFTTQNNNDIEKMSAFLDKASSHIAATRPTAINLFWALNRMKKKFDSLKPSNDTQSIYKNLYDEAQLIHKEDVHSCKTLGRFGAEYIKDGDTIMTHCNAGALATAGYGTALGVIRAAHEQGKKIKVFACETRPYLQGARLTSWELMKSNIDVTLISDNMAGFFMKNKDIDLVVVGADRIAANGDAANKIGTYSHSVLAKYHNIPFYVAAPTSTIDPNCPEGSKIPIEERDAKEITHIFNQSIAPEGINVRYPAFDVTPASYITAIVTEKGSISDPNRKKIEELLNTK